MKKVLYFLVTIIELAFIIGAYLFDYFAKAKLGMRRYLVYMNGKIEEQYPTQMIVYVLAVVIIVFMLIVICKALRIKKGRFEISSSIISVLISIFTGGFILLSDRYDNRAYYIVAVFMSVRALVQLIKSFVILNNKKSLK